MISIAWYSVCNFLAGLAMHCIYDLL
jgi:hypothetical protein